MSKGKKQKTAGADKANCSFRKAIENTPDVQHGYREGLQAIVKADKRAVMVKDARRLDGSLNIDEETKMLYPNESRWDYAVGTTIKVNDMFEQQQDTGKSASLEEEYAKVQAQFR